MCSPVLDIDPVKKKLPRILYFDHTAVWSGGEIALHNLVCELDKTKFQPIVLLGASGPLFDKLQKSGINCQLLMLDASIGQTRKDTLKFAAFLNIRRYWQMFHYILRLGAWFRKHEIDLVHTNSLKSDILGGLAARLVSVPVVWHIRDRIADDYLPSFATFVFRLAVKFIPDFVIANSGSTLTSLHLEKNEKSTTVYSGVDLKRRARIVHDGVEADSFRRTIRTALAQNDKIRIGLIGRISPWKGQHIFIQAASLVRQEFPNTKFLIVGSTLFGENDYETEINNLVDKLALRDYVDFMGFRDDITAVVEGLDIVVHASTTGEPFGQVIVEGMAASKPVVATNGGGVPEIVADQITGLLVPMNDYEAMARAIRKLLTDPDVAERMGKLGAARVQEFFTIEKTARDVENIYSKLLSIN